MSTISTRPPGLQHARRLRPARAPARARGAAPAPAIAASSCAVVDRQRFELAAPHVDVVERPAAACARPAACRPSRRRRSPARRTARAPRSPGRCRSRGRRPSSARIDQRRAARADGSDRRTARRAADPTARPPTRRTPATSMRRSASTLFSRRSSCSAPRRRPTCSRISGHSRRARRVEVVERHRVEAAGAVAPRRHPAVVGQRLQVAADGRLRQLQDAAQLGHGQLVPLEQQQHPAARRVGQRGQVVEDGGRRVPFIRISGLKDTYRTPSQGQAGRTESVRIDRTGGRSTEPGWTASHGVAEERIGADPALSHSRPATCSTRVARGACTSVGDLPRRDRPALRRGRAHETCSTRATEPPHASICRRTSTRHGGRRWGR